MSIRRIFPIPGRIRHHHPIRTILNQIRGRILILRPHLRHLRMNWRMIPSLIKQCIFLAVIGHALTYVPYILHKIWPVWTYQQVDMYLSSSFHRRVARYYYFKDTADNILSIISFLIIIKVSAKFSNILFLVFFIFLGYHLIDTALYWWDWNTCFDLYVDLFWTMLILINVAVFPYSSETVAKIKSMF